MPLGFYFSPASMNAQQYETCIARLKKAGVHHPAGRQYHACFGEGDQLKVFDVWTSQESFEKFGATLMPILQELGVDAGQPVVMPIYNVMVPPAKRARPAKKAAKPAKAKKKKKKTSNSTRRSTRSRRT
jgi:hypothetical protein